MEFYITNISKSDIHLSDLGIVVKSMTTVNIFGKKSIVTKKQLLESCLNGSIKKRLNKSLIIKLKAPKSEKKVIEVSNKFSHNRTKTAIVVEKKKIEDFDMLYFNDQNLADEQMIKEILEGED